MPTGRSALVRAIAEGGLGVLWVALGCSGGSPPAGPVDVPPPQEDRGPVQCLTPLDCPERECQVASGCIDGQCRYTAVFSPDHPTPCTPRTRCYDRAFCDAEGQCVTEEASLRSCDDDNPCTADSCDEQTGACLHAPLDETGCDDGDPCTADDRCVQGTCKGQPACACHNDDECPQPEDRCAARHQCIDHVCVPRPDTAVTCPDAPGPCQVSRCDPSDGRCHLDQVPDGSPCEDGNACTDGDACLQGNCRGTPRSCDDDNPCTEDQCDSTDGTCRHSDLTGPACDDHDPCTEGESCSEGLCGGGVPIPQCCLRAEECDDGDPCTADACDPTTHQCVLTAITPCCGNGRVEREEDCDDGNTEAGDGCSPRCAFAQFLIVGDEDQDRPPVRASVALSGTQERFLVVFHKWHPTLADQSAIRGRLFDLEGTPIGPSFPVHQTASLGQGWPVAAPIRDGAFLVAWLDGGIARYRRVSGSGTPLGPERSLGTGISPEVDLADVYNPYRVQATSLHAFQPAGSPEWVALLAWMVDQSPASNPRGAQYRCYYALLQEDAESGAWTALEGFPRPIPGDTFWQQNPQVLSDGSGSFLLLWTTRDPNNGQRWQNRMARVGLDGTLEPEVLVRESSGTTDPPSVSGVFIPVLGTYLVFVPLLDPVEMSSEIRGGLFTTALAPLGSDRSIFVEHSPSADFFPFLAGGGTFVFTFTSTVTPTEIWVKAQRLSVGGYAQGISFPLHRLEPGMHYGATVAPHPRGGFFAVWNVNQSGTLSVEGQMFPPLPN